MLTDIICLSNQSINLQSMKTVTMRRSTYTGTRTRRQTGKPIRCCTYCNNLHYKNVWYAPNSRFALLIDESKDSLFYSICPACEMQRDGKYEGVLYLRDVPKELDDKVMSLILQEAEQDYLENPQHRVLEFSNILDGHKITANSAKMVQRISEKIQEVFGPCELRSTYKQNPHPLQIAKITFVG